MSTDISIDYLARTAPPAQISPAQHRAAKVVGIIYPIQMAIAIFGEVFVRNRLIVPRRRRRKTAANLVASERLFRLILAGDLMIYASWSSYCPGAFTSCFKPVNRDVALLGAFFRLLSRPSSAVATVNSRLHRAATAERLRLPPRRSIPGQLQSLVMLAFISTSRDSALASASSFLGLGSAVFSYVLAEIALRPESSGRSWESSRRCFWRSGLWPSWCFPGLRGHRHVLHDADGSLRSRPGPLAPC